MGEKTDLQALVIWLCSYQADLNALRDSLLLKTPAEMEEALIVDWPMVQGTRNKLNLARIGAMPCDLAAMTRAVRRMVDGIEDDNSATARGDDDGS